MQCHILYAQSVPKDGKCQKPQYRKRNNPSFIGGALPPKFRRKHSLCLMMMNGMMERLSNRKWSELFGRYIFGMMETE